MRITGLASGLSVAACGPATMNDSANVLLVGTERSGISRELRDACDVLVRIPMVGKLDSLNVAVAGSLVLYEVFAQRLRAG